MTSARLADLAATDVDVLVVGGGVVGTGIARDLARRGAQVALVEQHDLASGTSSRPTRLIHGGLRYLEQFDFGLVRTDMREREVLLRIAPHLVRPLRFLLPFYDRDALYRARLRFGMQLYDVLSYDKTLPSRRWQAPEVVRELEPGLNPAQLQGAWQFYDGQVPLVERLVVENALDAAAHGACIVTHARLTRFRHDEQGAVDGAVVADELSHEQVEVHARLTINATGPWVDLTSGQLRESDARLLRLTKGVHLVMPAFSQQAHVLFARRDGRLFFVVPWLGYTLVGTTDTDFEGDPATAAADPDDVAYLLDEVRLAFPDAPIDQVHYTWAGVRALGRVDDVAAGKVSRKHAIYDHERRDGVGGVLTVVGGKLTGYRAIAAEVGDLALARLGLRARESDTEHMPLPGGRLGDLTAYIAAELRPRGRELGLDAAQISHLGQVYGSLAPAVLDRVAADPALGARLCPHQPTSLAEAARARDEEWALTLGDLLLRRTTIGLQAAQGCECLPEIAARVGALYGWDRDEQARQVAAYRAELEPMRRLAAQPAGT